MKKEIDIEKVLYPNQYILTIEDGAVHTQVIDLELDPIECIVYEDYIELNTEDLSYIQLDINKLDALIQIINEAKKYYRSKAYKELDL
jgi:hypothetical protein